MPEPSQPLDAGTVDATDAPPATPPSECSEGGFCYVNVPSVGPLIAVSASSPDDAWMVAQEGGAIVHWDGTSLKQVYAYDGASPSGITFADIWAAKKDEVWAAARGNDGHVVVVRYSSPSGGGAPAFRQLSTQAPADMIFSVWGTPAGDALWMVTDRGVLRVREDGSGAVVDSLSPPTGPEDAAEYSWRGVWGFGTDDVYVAGKVCPYAFCEAQASQGILAHYDGANWSITTLASASELQSLRGTPPGTDRQLWYVATEHESPDGPTRKDLVTTYLVPIAGAGPGAPLFSHPRGVAPACTSRIGQAAAPTSGWFSDGLLLCRWTGTAFEPTQTARGGVPVMQTVNGIWASGPDDAWIVGTALTRSGLPPRGFAARRTAVTAKGGQP
jgi:hypothetical protein